MSREAQIWRWEARKSYYTTIGGKQYKLSPDRREANRLLKELKRSLSVQTKAAAGSLAGLIDDVLDWVEKNRSVSTYDAYSYRCQSFLDHVGDIDISEVTPRLIHEWTNRASWGDGMRWTCIGTLKTVFNRGVRLGLIPSNPIQHVERPSPGKREHFITPEQHEKVLELVTDQAFKELLTVAWECGPRPQEILRVEARHLDIKGKRWVFPTSESKGKKKIRVVNLTDAALEICRRRAKEFPEGKLFRNSDGTPWTPFAVNCRFERLKKPEKLGQKLCLYLYRHAWMTRMLLAGNDPITVAAMGGHSDPSTLAKIYQHVLSDTTHVQRALAKLK